MEARMLQHERFDAYKHALDLLEHVREVAVDSLPKGSRPLGQRIIAAGSSLVVEIASAVGQPSTAGKRRAFRMAILAATKCAAVFDVLRSLAVIGEDEHV